MTIKLQLVFILASILTFILIIMKIRKSGINIEDSITWILWSVLLLIFSFFPQISFWISNQLGFMAPSNFILVLFILFLYIMVFTQNLQISKLKERQKELIQKLSLKEFSEREGLKSKNQNDKDAEKGI